MPEEELERLGISLNRISSWGIIGASFESGALNWWAPDGSIGRTDNYPCSWGKILQRRFGLQDVYNFSNGSQTTPGWVLGSKASHVFEGNGQQPHPNFPHVFGVDQGGGDWSFAKRHPKQAYIVVLGSNDINTLMRADPTYTVGSLETDKGTFNPSADSDIKPNGDPGIAHTYAGYLCALIERLQWLNPSCTIFVATIRRQFVQDGTPHDVWNSCNNVIRTLPKHFNNVFVIDYAQHGPDYDSSEFQNNYWEIRHPNKQGYEVAASCYARLVEEALDKHTEGSA